MVWKEGVSFGIGFGGIGAILLGLWTFIIALLVLTIPDKLHSQLLSQYKVPTNSLLLTPLGERFSTVLIHIFLF